MYCRKAFSKTTRIAAICALVAFGTYVMVWLQIKPLVSFNLYILSEYGIDFRSLQDAPVDPSFVAPRPARKPILILGLGRSGTSFLGELFNNHRDVLYIYEPLHRAETSGGSPDEKQLQTKSLLLDLMHCRVTEDLRRQLLTSSFILRSKALVSQILLNDGSKNESSLLLEMEDLQKLCSRKFTHVVVKELQDRIPGGMRGIFDDVITHEDAKVLHIVRDPRPTFISHMRTGLLQGNSTEKIRLEISRMCRELVGNVSFGLRELRARGRYEIFRYEDLCSDFESEVRRILQFVELPIYEEYEWYLKGVRENTVHDNDVVSLIKDSRKQLNLWRSTQGIEELVLTVESVCSEAMALLGYKRIFGDFVVLRNLSIPLHKKLLVENM